jgi:class 3 adenylate cyclase/tetratricopeptide (TPR) repeat protein
MRCSRCHADNPAGMKFCGQCGARLGSTCTACGADNPPEHRFCSQCGASLDTLGFEESAGPQPYFPKPTVAPSPRSSERILPGEMKQVTVLFCDIVDSTPLTERLGSEAMRDLVASFLETSLAQVRRYGGVAPQFLGDGFMALFGAPLAQEDHVQRALLAALAIQSTLVTGADRPHPPVRIGIHTGPAVFGPVGGGLAMESTVIGDTANVGSRLQQAAEPGTILLSEATRLLAREYARVEPVGPLALKGKADPTPAYRLLGVSHRRSMIDAAIAARPTLFVGRSGELAVLNDFFAQTERGRGRAIGIVGEPGIGKSRLLVEFRRQLPEGRFTWVEGRCLSYGAQIPYLPILDVLRSNCGIVESDPPDVIADKIRRGLREVGIDPDLDSPILLDLFGIKDVADSATPLNPEAVKSRTFEVLRKLCVRGSERRPLVLVLEDLHWIDNISEDFIATAADDLPGARILLLSTYRPGYRPLWMEKSFSGQIALQPLSRDDSLRMVRSVLAVERLGDPLTKRIVARADGNPFFLEQLALNAKDLRAELMVPNTIHDVVMARIDRLPDETKQLLQTASVIGREFSRRLLRKVWNRFDSLRNGLRELRRLEFIYERPEPEGIVYGFRHALTQEAVYGSLLERHRRARHGAVGRALEELYEGRAEEVAELLAFHFGRSDEIEKAVDYAIRAAEKAQRRWANNEALAYFNEALHHLDAMPDTPPNRLRRIDAVIKQAEVEYALGHYTEQIQALEEIRSIVNESGDSPRRAAWHYWTGFLHSTSGARPEVAIEHCREAAKIAVASRLDELNALAQSGLTQVYMVAGRLHDAIEAGERALSTFEARGNRWMAARTLWHLTSVANCLGNWEASLGYCNRGLEHGIALDDLRFKVVGSTRMGSAYIQQGDIERGIRCCNEALALSPIPRDTAWARVVRGYGMIKAGYSHDGITELSEALPWFESTRMQWTHIIGSAWLAEGYLQEGNPAAARPLIENVLKTSRQTGYLHYEGRACWMMAECVAIEAPGAAEDSAETATRIFERVGARNDLAKAMVTRSALRQRAGDVPTARRLLEQACAIFQALGTLDEPARVKAALSALDRGSPIPLLAGAS